MDDMSIEEMIEIELAKTDISLANEKEMEENFEAEELDETELVSEELPESVVSCLKVAEGRVKHLEECVLQDTEDTILNVWCRVILLSSSDYLKDLASEYKEDPEVLMHKILSEIEEENRCQSRSNHVGSPFPSECGKNTGLITKEEQDDKEVAVTLDYIEVEEKCMQELLHWEEEQNKMEENKLSELKMLKELHEKQLKDEDEKKLLRMQQLDEERKKLEFKHAQQQAELDEKLQKEQAVLQEELKQQEEVIKALQLRLEEERKLFEEQKANEEKKKQEKRHRAAVIIQAQFRAFAVYKKYAPVLKLCREERQRKKEMKIKMKREKKEMEEKVKRKLAEQKRLEEEERKKQEAEKLQREEAELRRIQYEKKKEEERLRYKKEKQIMLEQQQKEKEERLKREELERKVREQEENRKAVQRKECREATPPLNGNINAFPATESENEMESRKKNKSSIQSDIGCREESKQSVASSENITLVVEVTTEIEDAAVNARHCDQNDGSANSKFIIGEVSEGVQGESSATLNTDKNDILETVDGNLPHVAVSSNESVVSTALNSAHEIGNNDSFVMADSTGELSHSLLILPDHVEKRRLSWMQCCTPWARISNENKRQKCVKKNRPRRASSCQLPPLGTDVILHSGNWKSLQQVTTVTLQDLPGFSLSTFSECPKLKCLKLRHCGLIALEGLNNCKELHFIDVQENAIKTINCLDLEHLRVLLLNHNRLTSIHGLDGCTNLRVLELSHNNVTRLGNLESLKMLQHVDVSHNQLISTKGLNETPALLYLDCSFNHLTSVDGIEHCGLLQILKLQGNNLTEFPKLENHVLLREIYMDDNSISSLKNVSACWLPLLKVVSLSQNSLTSLPPMSEVILLEKLYLSNNCLADMKSASEWFNGCDHLLEVTVDGNPLQQDTDWRETLLKIMPSLKFLNGRPVDSSGEHHMEKRSAAPEGSFLTFCQHQQRDFEVLLKNHAVELGNAHSVVEAAEIQCRHLGELMHQAEDHRYAHEYGDFSVSDRNEPETRPSLLNHSTSDSHHFNKHSMPGAKENKQNTSSTSKRWMTAGQRRPTVCANFSGSQEEQTCTPRENTEENGVNSSAVCKNKRSNQPSVLTEESVKYSVTIRANMVETHLQPAQQNNLENFAATVIQAHWRGYVVRRDLSFFATLHTAATVIQSAWRRHCIRRKMGQLKKFKAAHADGNRSEQSTEVVRVKAATLIQAAWKGFQLRKKLASALAAVRKDETEDEFEEVNLDEFVYNEDTLEKEWLMLDSECFPSETRVMSNHLHRPKPPSNAPVTSSSGFPWQPPQVWHRDNNIKVAVKPGSPLSLTRTRQCGNSADSRTVSRLSQKSTTADSDHGFRKQKEEKLSEEWGFKDVQTAQLMLKRAQKMKSKKARNKKMLDPAVRLALFKNNENKHPPVILPKKVQPARVDYFKAREEEFTRRDSSSSENIERGRELTYQWLHTQVEDYNKPASSRIMKSGRFLPALDPDVLNGGRVQLLTSPASREVMDLEIVSVASGSCVSLASEKNNQSRRHLVEVAKKHMPAKSNSAPSKKERISFRDNPVQQSIGWGCGKKRGTSIK